MFFLSGVMQGLRSSAGSGFNRQYSTGAFKRVWTYFAGPGNILIRTRGRAKIERYNFSFNGWQPTSKSSLDYKRIQNLTQFDEKLVEATIKAMRKSINR